MIQGCTDFRPVTRLVRHLAGHPARHPSAYNLTLFCSSPAPPLLLCAGPFNALPNR